MARSNRKSAKRPSGNRSPTGQSAPVGLRIVGGKFRGRKLLYDGGRRVRPMKDRVREAVFNLVGPAVRGKHAMDLFAGTGALALEALSRGAVGATLVEEHGPTAAITQRNIDALGVESICRLVKGNVFSWYRRRPDLPNVPWLVFCSPPYDFYVQRTDEMLALVVGLVQSAPDQSVFVVESDDRFDFAQLPVAEQWDVRTYRPALVGIYRKR